ncbi:2262_t:CDS:2, partial [Funneliformis geosporum]
MFKVSIPLVLVSTEAPKNNNPFYSLFSLKTPSQKFPLKSPQKSPIKSLKSTTSSKNEIRYVLNGAKRVLTKFQHFNHHHELCAKSTRFIEQVIKILEEIVILSNNKRDQLIETKEYNDCSTLIFEIEYYFKKYDQRNTNQSVVMGSFKKFVLNLEIVVNALQRASELLKPKKVSKWNPSTISKIKMIGKLMVMKKESERIKNDGKNVPITHEKKPIFQQGLNIPTSEVEDPSNIQASVEGSLKVPTIVEDSLNVSTNVEDLLEVSTTVEDILEVSTSVEDPLEVPTIVEDSLNVPTNVEDLLEVSTTVEDILEVSTTVEDILEVSTSVEDLLEVPTSVEDPLKVPTSVEDPLKVPTSVEDPLNIPTNDVESALNISKSEVNELIIQREVIIPGNFSSEDESSNEPIIPQDIILPTGFIKQELIISTGLNHGGNNEGILFNNKVSEKCIGIITNDSVKFTEFQKEMSYIMRISCDCDNILSVKGYTERNLSSMIENPSTWCYIVNFLLSSFFFFKSSFKNKYATMLVTEWIEFNLPDYLKENELGWSTKISIARGIANALNHIHNLNLLHYNVKSDSVLLDHNLEPKLYKFGKDEDSCVFLKSARSLELSNWSAPEVKQKGKYTSASEVYSFGVILWEIATQECLSGDKSIEKRDIDDAPTNYLTLMERALDQEPQNRPTMQEMFDSLSQLEYIYNDRQQKHQNLSIKNIINIIHTNSSVSNSFNDYLSIDSASSSRVTSRANSPVPSISDHDYMFFNTISRDANSTNNDESTSSFESPISTNKDDYNSDNEISSTFTLTNDVDYNSDTETFTKNVETTTNDEKKLTSTKDIDYNSDTKSSTNITKDVETNSEKSPTSLNDLLDADSSTSTNDVNDHSDAESSIFTNDINDHYSTSTNDIDYYSDTKSSTNFIKDVENNAEKSSVSSNDIHYYSDAESSTSTNDINDHSSTSTNDIDYHSDTKSSTIFIKDVETNAEKSPTSTSDINDHSSTSTNDIDYNSDTK